MPRGTPRAMSLKSDPVFMMRIEGAWPEQARMEILDAGTWPARGMNLAPIHIGPAKLGFENDR